MLNHLLQNQKHTVKEKQDMRYTQISGNHFTKVDLFISLTNFLTVGGFVLGRSWGIDFFVASNVKYDQAG